MPSHIEPINLTNCRYCFAPEMIFSTDWVAAIAVSKRRESYSLVRTTNSPNLFDIPPDIRPLKLQFFLFFATTWAVVSQSDYSERSKDMTLQAARLVALYVRVHSYSANIASRKMGRRRRIASPTFSSRRSLSPLPKPSSPSLSSTTSIAFVRDDPASLLRF